MSKVFRRQEPCLECGHCPRGELSTRLASPASVLGGGIVVVVIIIGRGMMIHNIVVVVDGGDGGGVVTSDRGGVEREGTTFL